MVGRWIRTGDRHCEDDDVQGYRESHPFLGWTKRSIVGRWDPSKSPPSQLCWRRLRVTYPDTCLRFVTALPPAPWAASLADQGRGFVEKSQFFKVLQGSVMEQVATGILNFLARAPQSCPQSSQVSSRSWRCRNCTVWEQESRQVALENVCLLKTVFSNLFPELSFSMFYSKITLTINPKVVSIQNRLSDTLLLTESKISISSHENNHLVDSRPETLLVWVKHAIHELKKSKDYWKYSHVMLHCVTRHWH